MLDVEQIISLDRESFLDFIFEHVSFEEWEQEIISERLCEYEQDEEFIKMFDIDGELLVDIEVLEDGELELLSTFFGDSDESKVNISEVIFTMIGGENIE